MTLEQYAKEIITFLQKTVKTANAKGVIVGLSGGIDSAVVALLMQKAFPQNHCCLILPCQSDELDKEYAQNLVKTHNLTSQVIDLTSTFNNLILQLESSLTPTKKQLILGNIKARLRMTTLYAVAQNSNYLVVGTDNADEWYVGYFTKYGDGGVDLLPIVHLLKQDVVLLAKLLGVNQEIIARTPTANLFPSQTDEAEMGVKYAQLDQYLLGNKSLLSTLVISKIEAMHNNSEHKRQPIVQAPKWK